MPQQYKWVEYPLVFIWSIFTFLEATMEEVSGLLLDYFIFIPQPSMLEFLPSKLVSLQKVHRRTIVLNPLGLGIER